jgi:uncharacterized SAM-binding protein YcdF (DUF218 family)
MEIWSISWALRNLLFELLTPPGVWIVGVLIMLFLFKKHDLNKKALIGIGLLMIWGTSTNYFAVKFTNLSGHWLTWPAPLTEEILLSDLRKSKAKLNHQPQAIIVLGGGRRKGALESAIDYHQQDLSSSSLERLRYGARLAKQTNLPILVTGGAPDKTDSKDLAEAELMKMVLEKEYALSAKWVERQSSTTQENALFSAEMLKKDRIQCVYLVTHFWHMPRAKNVFEKQGFIVMEAPMGFYQKTTFTPLDFYPSSEGFQRTRSIWHEILGLLWYKLK